MVAVPVTVTDRAGRFVSGLTADEFELTDAGERRTITQFTTERVPVSLGILLDISGSMATDPKARAADDARWADTRRALTPTGILISNGGGHSTDKLGRVIRAAVVSMVVRQQARPSVKSQNLADLEALRELVDAGKVTPVIGGTYPLAKTADAIGHVASGHARGTLVIAVAQPPVPDIRSAPDGAAARSSEGIASPVAVAR